MGELVKMAEVKWIKLNVSMFDDEKIRIIEGMPEADSILVIWIKLLTMSGKKNMNGYIFLTENIPYTEEMLAGLFNRPLSTVKLALETFRRFNMIDFNDNKQLHITNWDKHQNIEGLDKIREQTKRRVANYREKQKELPIEATPSNATVTLPVTQGNATEVEEEVEKIKKEKGIAKVKYAEFVSMTEREYQTLVDAHGESATKTMIEILDNYKGSKGKTYKSDYRAILSWVVDRYKEDESKRPKQNTLLDVDNPYAPQCPDWL